MAEQSPAPKRRKKKKSPKEAERNREYQKGYYEENKGKLAADRARRYREDPDYQRRMKMAAKRRYWLDERAAPAVDPKLPDIAFEDVPPKGTMVVKAGGKNREVAVYTTAALEAILGRNAQTLRLWLKDGILPEPYYRGNPPGMKLSKGRNPRLITKDELRAIYDCREMLGLPSHGKQYDIFTRCVEEKFGELTQGVRLG